MSSRQLETKMSSKFQKIKIIRRKDNNSNNVRAKKFSFGSQLKFNFTA